MTETRAIYCCGCQSDVQARLTDGREIYGHRPDLHDLPFWKCDACGNNVGCHWKTKDRTAPLGCIPTSELKNARRSIHQRLDPLWKTRRLIKREHLYARLTDVLGRQYHTAELRTIDEARIVYAAVVRIEKELTG